MANIAITTYCNLKCAYCFADDMICQQHQNITIDRFREILEWLSRTPDNHVGIIGGEPTLHPKFSEILKEVNNYCRELRTNATLFTNGIHLDKYVSEIGQSTGLLININAPDSMKMEQWANLNNTLEHLNILDWFHPGMAKANIGCNLHYDRDNYDFIWEIVDRYGIKHVRVSVTAPIKDEHKKHKHDYFAHMKPIYMKFIEDAISREVVIGSDCAQIPNCYFTEDELDKIFMATPEKNRPCYCEPVVDITPDFTATACFGCYDPVDCTKFQTLPDLRRYMLHTKNWARMQKNCEGRCANCENKKLLLCQGGCLAFADMDNE